MKKKACKQINPRLANGNPRIDNWHCLPAGIKDGLRAIARDENKSVSRILEEVIIDYFNLPKPRYIKPSRRTDHDRPRTRR